MYRAPKNKICCANRQPPCTPQWDLQKKRILYPNGCTLHKEGLKGTKLNPDEIKQFQNNLKKDQAKQGKALTPQIKNKSMT